MELIGLTIGELEKIMNELGEPSYRARQLAEWIYEKGITDLSQMTNVPLDLRKKMIAHGCRLPSVKISKAVRAQDGTTRYLFLLRDGREVEGVFIPEKKRKTVCYSTQVGCGMACAFCATGQGGLFRNLTAGEIIDQILRISFDQKTRISNTVAMGQGEPLANYEQVVKAIRIMNADYGLGIAARHLTVSTCGIIPAIYRLAQEEIQLNLAVSLHSTDEQRRDELVPVNRVHPLPALKEACKHYVQVTNRRITLEYTMIKGVNDQEKDLRGLIEFCRGWLCHVNLIPFNSVPGTVFKASGLERVRHFVQALQENRVPASIREERGAEIAAACGQLKQGLTEGDRE